MMDAAPIDYPLGYTDAEAERLATQAGYLGKLTERLFTRAGLRPGMRVIEAGCGVGDVTMIIARLVGPQGRVLAVDRDGTNLDRARQRTLAAGFDTVDFLRADLPDLGEAAGYDALVGRFVMIYFPDPVAVLSRLVPRLRPGGVVAFLEPDFAISGTSPATPVTTLTLERLNAVFSRCGFHPSIGSRLGHVFAEAGLPLPALEGIVPMEQGGRGFSPAWLVSTVQSLEAAMIRTGVATAAELGGGVEAAIRAELDAQRATIYGPLLVGAVATVAA